MSRTREGRDKEANETARQQAESQPVTETGGQPSASRPSSYTSGRESMREFPRRSTSLRNRDISESRDLYDRGYPREGRSYDRESQRDEMHRSDYGDRTQSPTYYAGYYR
ncbi:MAG TPA: hypothetical protein VFQ92_16710, partial [Blastocatellia bacterium]|nr:hypothetical protein [Blastocatellia bacterium]